MNVYAVVILATLLLDYGLNVLADLLNLHRLTPELPEAFHDVYDADAYRTSQRYTRAQTHYEWVTSSVVLGVTLGFWFADGFQVLDGVVRGWALGTVGSGLAYIGLLGLGRALLALPFSFYETFVLEDRFGLNRTTLVTFVGDLVKGLGLAIVLGVPLLAGILAFFTYAGPYAWLYCWIATAAFMLGLQFVAPTWILPWFNSFRPLETGVVKDALLAYARKVNFSLQGVWVMDGSRRSTKPNAFLTGFGRHKRIALFDTLMAQLTPAELVAVLAHEVGHYKKQHILQGTLLNMLHLGVVFFLLSVFITQEGLFAAFYVEQPSVYAGLLFFGLLLTPLELILSMGMHIFSRWHEYEADRFAVATLDNHEAMAQALQKLSINNLSNLTPHPFYVLLHYSHPPVLKRVQAIRELAARLTKEEPV